MKVSCRFEATLQDKRLELKPLHAFDPFSQVQKTRATIICNKRTSYLWDSWSTFDFSSRSLTLKHFLKQRTPTNIVILSVEMWSPHLTHPPTTKEDHSVAVNLSTNCLTVRPTQGNGRCGFLTNKEINLHEVCLIYNNHFTFLNLFSSFCGPYM